ncbi:hypothetical protein GCM10009839_34510 [Catenulispora yoronensis]|uniref:Uncharacterized protein n=1 Tax=Catenulispora yoronensis TaxID=450799 RepID=A0ABN2U9I2_9ACTN
MGYLGGPTVDAAAGRVRAPLPAAPPGTPVRVRDVLLNCGRVLDAEELTAFGLYRRALRLLEDAAARFRPLADVLMIAASQTHGATDLLTGRPWADPGRKFVTVVFKGKVLRCPRLPECRLGIGCHSCPFPAASGVTLEGPPAVYAADASARRVADEVAAVRLAATLMHEYAHVALRRMYDNVSLPWFERESGPAAEVDPRIVRIREHRNARVSVLMQSFDGMKPVRHPDSEPNPELRAYLVDIALDWCTYGAGTRIRYQEAVPYVVEAYFHAVRLHRPDAVGLLFGMFTSTDPFLRLVAPEFADLAAVVRASGEITDN